MRQKKSNAIFYVLGAIAIVGILFFLSKEVNVEVETVEQPLENSFLK